MSRAIARRISRLEQAKSSRYGDELVEHAFSDGQKDLLRQMWTGLWTPKQIEAKLNERRLVPKSLLRPMSPEMRAMIDEHCKHKPEVGRSHGPAQGGGCDPA